MQLLIYFLIIISLLTLRSSARLLIFLWGLIRLLFFRNKHKKNSLIKARKLYNIFRFIDDLNSINDGAEFVSNYSDICPEDLQINKQNTDKHEASFLDLNIKKKDGKFRFCLFDKRDSFPFSIVRMPDKSSNVPSSIVHSPTGAESLRIARASNNFESFSAAVKPLIARMSRQGVPIQNINSSILNFLTNIIQILIMFVKVSKNF